MTFFDIPTKEMAQRMAHASVYIDKIGKNDAFSAWYRGNIGKPLRIPELFQLGQLLLAECYDDVVSAIAILTGKEKQTVEEQPIGETIKEINEFTGGKLARFFSVFSATEAEE